MLPMRKPNGIGASILRTALAVGVTVLLGIGLSQVFPRALPGAAGTAPSHLAPQRAATASSWSASVLTTDELITVTLAVSPNQVGKNTFTVKLVATATDRVMRNASVSLFITMLDMKMATASILLQPDGEGQFHGTSELPMGGDWGIRLLIRTTDHRLHEAQIHLLTSE